MPAGAAEAEPGQKLFQARGIVIVGGEFDEAHALGLGARRQDRHARCPLAGPLGELIEQEAQRAMAVDGKAARGARTELVVEDLERQRAVITGRRQRLHEIEHRQLALAREVAEVPAPRQIVHLQQRRVGQLHQEDAVAGNGADGAEIGAARQDMEGIEHQSDGGMVGAPHRLPGVAVVVDVAAPGQRLEGDAQAAAGGPLAQLAQVGSGAVDAAQRFGRHVAADHQEIGAELLHDVELALGAIHRALATSGRHALEVAERLKGDDVEPQLRAGAAHVCRRAVEGYKVVLEDLDRVELGVGDGFELFAERAAQGDCRNRGLHDALQRESVGDACYAASFCTTPSSRACSAASASSDLAVPSKATRPFTST